MNPDDDQFDKIFSVLSSYRAKPFDRIQNQLLRGSDEPAQQRIMETLSNQLESLVQDSAVDRVANGYKLNPFHPFHSLVVPEIRLPAGESHPIDETGGPSTSTALELCNMPGMGRMTRKSYQAFIEEQTAVKRKARKRSRSKSRSAAPKTARKRSTSRPSRRNRAPGR